MGFFKKKQAISWTQMAELNYDKIYYSIIEDVAASENILHILNKKKNIIKKSIVDLLVLYYQTNNKLTLTKDQQSELNAHIFYYLAEIDSSLPKDKVKAIKHIMDLVEDEAINNLTDLKNKIASLVSQQILDIVIINIIDPLGGVSIEDEYEGDVYKEREYIRREYWEVDNKKAFELTHSLDSLTLELYMIYAYQNGERKQMLTTKQIWFEMKDKINQL